MAGQPNKGGGSDAIAGYEYQIDVSVWLALDIVLGSRLAQELVLEPATQEDLEGDLEEFEPGRLTSITPMKEYRLVVQAKLRSGDAWTSHSLKALLMHGRARKSVCERLSDPYVRYLLVTNSAVNGGIRDLRVRRAGVWPMASTIPRSIAKAIPIGATGRLAIVAVQDEERLASDIETLLTNSFRVPRSRLNECRHALREQARSRIGHEALGLWKREDLEQVVKQFGGYVGSFRELEDYVYPSNWPDIRSAMDSRHAVLLVGQFGTGKTMAAKKLHEDLREVIPGLSHVPITGGPQQLSNDRTLPPVLYSIEDPWGRFSFDPKSRPWNDQLAKLLRSAAPETMVVVTSRFDVAQSSGALETVQEWMIRLDAEHYGDKERHELYRKRIDQAAIGWRSLVATCEATVLAKLRSPLEIQRFFDAMAGLARGESVQPQTLIQQAIQLAHRDSIERTVIEQIEERADVRAAAILWSLLKVDNEVSLEGLRQVEEELSDIDDIFSDGLSPLVSFWIAGRSLRQDGATIAYYHPSVEAGVEMTLRRHPLVTRKALGVLVEVLLKSQSGLGGKSAVAKLLEAASRFSDIKPRLSPGAQSQLDAWLDEKLTRASNTIRDNLDLAAAVGSPKSALSELARFILSFRSNELERSGPLNHDLSWYSFLRDHPGTQSLIRNFIISVLPGTSHEEFDIGLVSALEKVAPESPKWFQRAAGAAMRSRIVGANEVLREGALRSLDDFEGTLDTAVEIIDDYMRGPSEESSDDDCDVHIRETEGVSVALELEEAYVERVRATGEWHRLVQHRHLDHLLYDWQLSLRWDPAPDVAEIEAIGEAVRVASLRKGSPR
jgi:hypothetical protein